MSKRRRKWIKCEDAMPQDFYNKKLRDVNGEEYIGYWRPDANRWDNSEKGWVYAEIVEWKNIPIEEE